MARAIKVALASDLDVYEIDYVSGTLKTRPKSNNPDSSRGSNPWDDVK